MRDRLTKALPWLATVLIAIQPPLAALGWWQVRLGLPNALTLGLRLFLLAAMLVPAFLLSDRKWVYGVLAGGLCLLTAGHIAACLQTGYDAPVEDLANLVHIYTLPLATVCFVTFLRRSPGTMTGLLRGMALSLAGTVLILVLASATGTEPHTYPRDGHGLLGWFLWTNTESAILSIVFPLSVAWALRRFDGRILPAALVTLLGAGTLWVLAPRLAYAALAAIGLGFALLLLLSDRRRWKQALAIFLCTALFLGLYPVSPMAKRRAAVQAEAEKNAAHASERQEAGEGDDGDKLLHLYLGYEYQYGPIQRFGAERVMAAYNYTDDAAVLSDQRLRKLTFCRLLMEDAPVLGHVFGLELADMRVPMVVSDDFGETWYHGYQNNDVENDFHGIYYLLGWSGLILWIGAFAAVLALALRALLRKRKRVFTPDFIAFSLAFAAALVHVIFTASLLRRNNGAMYLAPVLAGLLWLSLQKAPSAKGGDPDAETGD